MKIPKPILSRAIPIEFVPCDTGSTTYEPPPFNGPETWMRRYFDHELYRSMRKPGAFVLFPAEPGDVKGCGEHDLLEDEYAEFCVYFRLMYKQFDGGLVVTFDPRVRHKMTHRWTRQVKAIERFWDKYVSSYFLQWAS